MQVYDAFALKNFEWWKGKTERGIPYTWANGGGHTCAQEGYPDTQTHNLADDKLVQRFPQCTDNAYLEDAANGLRRHQANKLLVVICQ